MRHIRRFDLSLADRIDGCLHLIFETRYLRRTGITSHFFMIDRIDDCLLRVVDIVDDYISFISRNNSLPVVRTESGHLQNGHAVVSIYKSNTALQIHPRLPFHAGRSNSCNLRTEKHPCKVDRINADIQQSSATKFGLGDTFLLGNRIADIGCQHHHAPDRPAVDQFAERPGERHITCPDRFSQENLFLFRQAYQRFRLLCIGGKCFFT